MRAELTEVLWMDEHLELTMAELAELSGLTAAELDELADCGAIAPLDPSAAARTFRADCIVAARAATRLRDHFELDAHGMAVVVTLLERVRELEAELREVRAQLPQGRHRAVE